MVLRPVDLTLLAGAVCAVGGPNGAGKTTLLRVASGLLAPTTGRVTRAGVAVYLGPRCGARRVQTVTQVVAFVAGRHGDHEAAVIDEALEVTGLSGMRDRRVATLSAGQRGRVTLAVALAARAAVTCLDEPTAHLDDAGTQVATAVAGRLAARGCAVLVATHDGERLGATVDQHVRLRAGFLEAA